VYLLVFHAYINEMHDSRSKIPSKKSRPYIHDVKFLALLGAPYIYDSSRLRIKRGNLGFHTASGEGISGPESKTERTCSLSFNN
jgi:hypothetical protein